MPEGRRVGGIIAGREIELETGCVARSAHGAVVARQGGTVVLAAVVTGGEVDAGFVPLTVDYRERSAAAGRIPGGSLRRDARSTEAETLAARLVDRSIRPLFPERFRRQTQMSITVMSYEPGDDPVVLAVTAASAALCCSEIPWAGPVAAVRVAGTDRDVAAFPSVSQRAASSMELIAAFARDGIIMAEGRMQELSEQKVLDVIGWAHAQVGPLLEAQESLRTIAGGAESPAGAESEVDTGPLEDLLLPWIRDMVRAASVRDREAARNEAVARATEALGGRAGPAAAAHVVSEIARCLVRRAAMAGERMDGRGLGDVRPISARTGWLPRVHGSALFTRGDTQASVTCTLGTGRDELHLESLEGTIRRSFLVHYNFPQYAVGELGQWKGPARRELGHGNLARMALEAVVPSTDTFPFTVRVESEITQSDGSSSMATVCGGSLALMDAGVPVSAAVAGVAMGMVREDGRHVVLTDITAQEDHAGDVDLKVAGTRTGLTALQMDTKTGGVPERLLAQALAQARPARLRILDAMDSVRDRPRIDPPDGVPRVHSLRIPAARVKELGGPSGKALQEIQTRTGTRIEIGRDGLVRVYGDRAESLAGAVARIRHEAGVLAVNDTYEGRIIRRTAEGARVGLPGAQEGFIPAEACGTGKEGDTVSVTVVGVDRWGRIELALHGAAPARHEPHRGDRIDV